MKQVEPMFSIETDPCVVIARPDGTRIVITGGHSRYRRVRSEKERRYPQLASFLERNPPRAH